MSDIIRTLRDGPAIDRGELTARHGRVYIGSTQIPDEHRDYVFGNFMARRERFTILDNSTGAEERRLTFYREGNRTYEVREKTINK